MTRKFLAETQARWEPAVTLTPNASEPACELVQFDRFDEDPRDPTDLPPGDKSKVRIFAARYATGLPIFHPNDRAEHEQQDDELMSQQSGWAG